MYLDRDPAVNMAGLVEQPPPVASGEPSGQDHLLNVNAQGRHRLMGAGRLAGPGGRAYRPHVVPQLGSVPGSQRSIRR
jgi:hypothetical protein